MYVLLTHVYLDACSTHACMFECMFYACLNGFCVASVHKSMICAVVALAKPLAITLKFQTKFWNKKIILLASSHLVQ